MPSPYETIRAEYNRCPHELEWEWWVDWHYQHGFVYATPDFFIMGKPVRKDAPSDWLEDPEYVVTRGEANAWYIFAFAGDMGKAWAIMPWPLAWIAFQRVRGGKRELAFYSTETLRRLCPPNLHHAPTESILATA